MSKATARRHYSDEWFYPGAWVCVANLVGVLRTPPANSAKGFKHFAHKKAPTEAEAEKSREGSLLPDLFGVNQTQCAEEELPPAGGMFGL